MRFKDLVFFVTVLGASAYLQSYALKKNGVWAILRKNVWSPLVISTQAICITPFVREGMEKSVLPVPLGLVFPPRFAWHMQKNLREHLQLPEMAPEKQYF